MGQYDRYTEFDFSNLPWGTIKKAAIPIIIGIVVIVGAFSSFFTVKANEEAVILRFGKYVETAGPGLHFKLPFGIDKVLRAEVKRIYNEEFGFRTVRSRMGESAFDYTSPAVQAESLMLTGDLNCANVHWVIRYKIKDLKDYLFNVRDVNDTIRGVSQSVMRQLAGDRSIDEVLTIGRTEIEGASNTDVQGLLNKYGCGIAVQAVLLKGVNPPTPVKDAFDAVNQAVQLRDKIINEAEGQKNKILPAAEGKKNQAIKEAEGYRIKRINQATGDTKAFLAVYEEYKNAEDVTRRRLYLETMANVLSKCEKLYIIDEEQKGILPILRLGEEGGKK
ncbi:MAG TPA: FtsH protease activity modulator HflK [Candidatus Brocadiales bacterium]|nr:FtsH protease activity modulator HflK [Candidatus Brocadiales bacterium]